MTSLSLIICTLMASPAITLFYMRYCNMIATQELGEQKTDEVKNSPVVEINLNREDKEIIVYPNFLKGNILTLYAN